MADWKYGIVIDSGSSGSRVQIFKWENPSSQADAGSSPPQIVQEENWSHKISPGISSLAGQPQKVWSSHYKAIVEFAERAIPAEKHSDTPIFVLSTAGMRLLPTKQRQEILDETCQSIKTNSRFIVSPCSDHVQSIDGATEGVYGWLALNYLMGTFNGYDPAKAPTPPASIGFMDMGGASTQIAFMPSSAEEISKHDEDLSTVVLRNLDGSTQKWRVFVETWLGFGANQARSRYLEHLVGLTLRASPKLKHKTILDPCMPKGSVLEQYAYGGKHYTIKGAGKYDSCVREIYPLLMKHFPCEDEPCLFNGVHAPKMNFETDKFIGVSEYWYTANDVFHSGGEYNFHSFNDKVKAFCESSWDEILQNSKNGDYSRLPESFLLTACFKASWVMNILHEGFELPRLDVDIVDPQHTSPEMAEAERAHVPFRSADSIEGSELSWTLGKILIEASGNIAVSQGSEAVGVMPSEISSKKMSAAYDSDSDDEEEGTSLYGLIVLLLLLFLFYKYGRWIVRSIFPTKPGAMAPMKSGIKNALIYIRSQSPSFVQPYMGKIVNYMDFQDQQNISIDMEEGNFSSPVPRSNATFLRTRSTINLGEDMGEENKPMEFLSRPFTKAHPPPYGKRSESRDSLHKSASTRSMSRSRNMDAL